MESEQADTFLDWVSMCTQAPCSRSIHTWQLEKVMREVLEAGGLQRRYALCFTF